VNGVEVELAAPRCEGCAGLCAWRMSRAQRMTFSTERRLAVGDRVVVALADRYLLLVSLLVYGLPLAGLLVGALLGLAALGSDLGAAAGAAAGAPCILIAAPALRSRFERATLRRMQLVPRADAHTHSL
jgi:sigma-E factor negative regulatory protein RseC